ncbi:MAG: hypothetical protein CL940_00800 [Deltaproteobacteria bacterium]|nr:hypothetical protein [Deltaproteobacteria bacterium]
MSDSTSMLVRSPHLSTFGHMGEVYLYHDLYGMILKMSPDVLEVLDAFEAPTDPDVVAARFQDAFGGEPPETFIGIFLQFHCLEEPSADPDEERWRMVPVLGRWNVWRQTPEGGMALWTAWGERPIQRHDLEPAQAAIYAEIDGETPLTVLAQRHGAEPVMALMNRLIHHEIQAVKLSQVPMSYYVGRAQMQPPYLTSTMPYATWPEDSGGRDPGTVTDTAPYHQEVIDDADRQFDHLETTLSHLFREPHPALGGHTYGGALVSGLAERGGLPATPGPLRVLEIGGGLGEVAASAVEALQERGFEVSWTILELSPELARAQRARCEGLPVTVKLGNVLTDPWPSNAYDLIVANEMMGDLPSAELTHAQAGLDDDELRGDAHRAHLAELGPIGDMINRYTIPLGDAPDPFWLNVGPIALVERVARHLAPGGAAVLTEFGEMSRWPVVSTHLDHPELSIHFGHLITVARQLELEPELVYVMELIGLDREVEGLQTTRSFFRALGAMLKDAGVSLRKIGYTREMFETLTAAVDGDFGDLRYGLIEDRLMGLVPHEFKALMLRREKT